MKIFITGGLGFIGQHLTESFLNLGHEVTLLNRSVNGRNRFKDKVTVIQADSTVPGKWQDEAASHDVIINLAGTSIFTRWTKKKKKEIHDSRILTTRNVADAISKRKGKKTVFFSTSAVGYYGFHGDEIIDETSSGGDDFLARVCTDWESEALKAEQYGARVLLCRFGVVLGENGGAFLQMKSLLQKHIASVLGSGKQWVSWIHITDLVDLFDYLIKKDNIKGPVNFTSPSPVTNREMTVLMAKAMKKSILLPPIPGFILRIVMGEFGSFLLKGQKVVPQKIADRGYTFQFDDYEKACIDLLE